MNFYTEVCKLNDTAHEKGSALVLFC